MASILLRSDLVKMSYQTLGKTRETQRSVSLTKGFFDKIDFVEEENKGISNLKVNSFINLRELFNIGENEIRNISKEALIFETLGIPLVPGFSISYDLENIKQLSELKDRVYEDNPLFKEFADVKKTLIVDALWTEKLPHLRNIGATEGPGTYYNFNSVIENACRLGLDPERVAEFNNYILEMLEVFVCSKKLFRDRKSKTGKILIKETLTK